MHSRLVGPEPSALFFFIFFLLFFFRDFFFLSFFFFSGCRYCQLARRRSRTGGGARRSRGTPRRRAAGGHTLAAQRLRTRSGPGGWSRSGGTWEDSLTMPNFCTFRFGKKNLVDREFGGTSVLSCRAEQCDHGQKLFSFFPSPHKHHKMVYCCSREACCLFYVSVRRISECPGSPRIRAEQIFSFVTFIYFIFCPPFNSPTPGFAPPPPQILHIATSSPPPHHAAEAVAGPTAAA
jgi:hypothetical protein